MRILDKIIILLGFLFLIGCSSDKNTVGSTQKMFSLLTSDQTGVEFSNTLEENVTDESKNILSFEFYFNGAGVATADFDNDGLDDIIFVSNEGDNKIFKNKGNLKFEDKTKDWLPNPIIENSITHVWIKLMDVDNNGSIDLVESEPKIWLYTSQFRNSLRWEWNGNGFTKVN